MNPLTAGLAVVVVVHGRPDGSARKPACLSRPPSFAHGTDGPRSRSTALEEIISRQCMPRRKRKPTCDRCGKVQMHNEAHAPAWRDRPLRDIIARMRHDGCGGRVAKAELLTGIEGVSSLPVRRIALLG